MSVCCLCSYCLSIILPNIREGSLLMPEGGPGDFSRAVPKNIRPPLSAYRQNMRPPHEHGKKHMTPPPSIYMLFSYLQPCSSCTPTNYSYIWQLTINDGIKGENMLPSAARQKIFAIFTPNCHRTHNSLS